MELLAELVDGGLLLVDAPLGHVLVEETGAGLELLRLRLAHRAAVLDDLVHAARQAEHEEKTIAARGHDAVHVEAGEDGVSHVEQLLGDLATVQGKGALPALLGEGLLEARSDHLADETMEMVLIIVKGYALRREDSQEGRRRGGGVQDRCGAQECGN